MLKKYTFWLKVAIFLQFLTGIFHSLSFLNTPKPQNESEKQLFDLMSNYKFDLGFGFIRSIENLLTSFSISLVLFLFFSSALNLFLLKKNLPANTMKGIILINFITYLVCFIVMLLLTFLPPIVCLGLITVALLIAYLALGGHTSKQ